MPRVLLFVLLVACSGEAPAPDEPTAEPGRTIVLVSFDTTRADALSCYQE